MKDKKEDNGGGLAYAIIGLVLLGAIIGGIYFYSSGGSGAKSTTRTNTNKATSPTPVPTINPNASQGAQPAHFKGSQNAVITIEEFADFQCGACAAIHPVMNEINGLYGSRVKFVFRHFPLVQAHPKAYTAAVASEAAGFQGKFWDMQNLIFQNQQSWSAVPDAQIVFEGYAQTLGLDMEKFKNDMAGMQTKQRVDADLARGRSLGVNQTPTMFINNRQVPFEQMSVQGLRQIIDTELQKTQGGGQ